MAQFPKYCYVIVRKENGEMLIEDGKLPIYWYKDIAKQILEKLSDKKYVIHMLALSEIETLILKSKRAF